MVDADNLRRLPRPECLRLMAEADIGRIVFTAGALPAIQPVNYLLADNEVIYRTANGAKLAAATRNSVVAFEVDEIDPETHTGWSVVAIGPCHEITDPDQLAGLATQLPNPWATNHTGHTIAIEIEKITGRLITHPGGVTPDFYPA
jgi:nitroimidazol reductase NimA-like FMN-containing flavoprotein (pyridoxamine 5'-phosphate oxidase superfamily)